MQPGPVVPVTTGGAVVTGGAADDAGATEVVEAASGVDAVAGADEATAGRGADGVPVVVTRRSDVGPMVELVAGSSPSVGGVVAALVDAVLSTARLALAAVVVGDVASFDVVVVRAG